MKDLINEGHVYLASERKNSLVRPRARLFARAARAVALDDKQLVVLGFFACARRELADEVEVV